MSKRPEILVYPVDSLSDQKVEITISSLPSYCKVTLQVSILSDNGILFTSCGQYISNGDGKVAVHTDHSYGGSYIGINQMGLLTSLSTERRGVRLFKKDVNKPYIVNLEVSIWNFNFSSIC